MTSPGRRALVISVIAFSCALIGYQLWPRDESRIGALLDELCGRLSQTKDQDSLAALRQFLTAALLPQISVRAPELGQDLQGVEEVSARAQDLLMGPPLSFALNSVEIKISGHLARVEAELLVSVRGGGEQRREVRRTRVRLAKHGESWQIEAVEVDPIAFSEPEARP
ncbi:MAG TPA: hypothetical protein VFK05_15210 [Polyangiaceae bacterium]|nr:hypothetical protein [Polyangiaceae bacterium]